MHEYEILPRNAIEVKPRAPILEWVTKNAIPSSLSAEDLQEETRIYLCPEFEADNDVERAVDNYIKMNYRTIFLNELEACFLDPSLFPELTYRNFSAWFEIVLHMMVLDMIGNPDEVI